LQKKLCINNKVDSWEHKNDFLKKSSANYQTPVVQICRPFHMNTPLFVLLVRDSKKYFEMQPVGDFYTQCGLLV
jgi:hypothetical protein